MIEIVDAIEKTEEFVKNLDNDISQWGAFEKLVKRDKEITYIKKEIGGMFSEIDIDIHLLEDHIRTKKEKMHKDKANKAEYEKLIHGLEEHLEESTHLKRKTQHLMHE